MVGVRKNNKYLVGYEPRTVKMGDKEFYIRFIFIVSNESSRKRIFGSNHKEIFHLKVDALKNTKVGLQRTLVKIYCCQIIVHEMC